jgi:hypothetical protein
MKNTKFYFLIDFFELILGTHRGLFFLTSSGMFLMLGCELVALLLLLLINLSKFFILLPESLFLMPFLRGDFDVFSSVLRNSL